MEERRRFVRLSAACEVRYTAMAAVSAPSNVLSKDVGGGGLRMPTQEKLKPGVVLEMEIKIHDKPSIFAIGKVAWARKTGSSETGFEAGIRFLNIDPADRDTIMAFTVSNG